MNVTKRAIGSLCLVCIFTGCASTSPSTTVDSDLAATIESGHLSAILGSSHECVFAGEPGVEAGFLGAVVGALLPTLVDKGVAGLTDYLAERRDERNAAYTASSSGRGASELYASNGRPDLTCLMVYRGERGIVGEDSDGWSVDDLKKLGLRTAPDFFLEAGFRYSFDGRSTRLVPLRLEYRKTAARRSSGTKDVLLSGYFEGVFAEGGEALENARFGAFQLYFPGLSEGTILRREEMRGISTQWIPLPAPTMDKEDKEDKGSQAAVSLVPVSAFVNLQEAEKHGDLLLGVLGALSDATTEKKDEISEAIAEALADRLGLDEEEEDNE